MDHPKGAASQHTAQFVRRSAGDALGLSDLASAALHETRRGMNTCSKSSDDEHLSVNSLTLLIMHPPQLSRYISGSQ